MIFEKFKISAMPFICDAYCECGKTLIEVSDGWMSSALYCEKCENVYALKMVKVNKAKISEKYLQQCREEVARKKK